MEPFHPIVAAAWASQELAGVPWSDRRLMKRAHRLMTQFAQQPNASIPQACGPWSQTKAAYRFFDNPAVKPEEILQAHRQATLGRMQERKVVLAVQDTTSLHYTHPCTEGLGPIAGNADKTLGLLLHTTLALSEEGQPLGVLAARSWARQERLFGSSRQSRIRDRQPLAQKESWRWVESLQVCQELAAACPGVLIVNIADREGDIYEALAQALAGPANVQWLVRMQHNRRLAQEDRQVWDLLACQPALATLEVQTPRRTGQAPRSAVLTVRVTPATVGAPYQKEQQPPLKLWAVEAREQKPPRGQRGLCWRLVSSAAVETAEGALEKIRWYAQRWQIETLHKTLKSGCQVEQRQLETVERLRRVLAFDLIVAWRVMALAWAARSEPEASSADWLEPEEWRVLGCHFHPQSRAPETAPPLAQAVRWIAQLGGFLGRNSDGPPGPIVLWRGLTRLHHMADLYSRLSNCG